MSQMAREKELLSEVVIAAMRSFQDEMQATMASKLLKLAEAQREYHSSAAAQEPQGEKPTTIGAQKRAPLASRLASCSARDPCRAPLRECCTRRDAVAATHLGSRWISERVTPS